MEHLSTANRTCLSPINTSPIILIKTDNYARFVNFESHHFFAINFVKLRNFRLHLGTLFFLFLIECRKRGAIDLMVSAVNSINNHFFLTSSTNRKKCDIFRSKHLKEQCWNLEIHWLCVFRPHNGHCVCLIVRGFRKTLSCWIDTRKLMSNYRNVSNNIYVVRGLIRSIIATPINFWFWLNCCWLIKFFRVNRGRIAVKSSME